MSLFPGGAQHLNVGIRQGVQQPQIPSQVGPAALIGHIDVQSGSFHTPPLCSLQPPLNAQMLAQRQRELYSIQHRQRQLFQQKVMLMRQNASCPPTSAAGPIGTARVPKGVPSTAQQFNIPAGYNPMMGNPPTSPSQFSSPMSGGPLDSKLPGRLPLNNQTLMGGVQGAVNASLQQGLFQQFGGSGEFQGPIGSRLTH